MPRERSERALRKERLYGPPLDAEGTDLPAREAWPERMPVRVGTSGWAYRHWLGRFYPRRLPSAELLRFYAGRFPTVEVNSTYYRLPPDAVFDAWRDAVPPGFRFAVKAPGIVTHEKRLVDVEGDVEEFLARCRRLGDRLGVVLWQFPPGFHADVPLLERFLEALPEDVRHAVELRHRSWFERDVHAALRARNVAFVVHDYNQKGTGVPVTADAAYLRLHGPSGRYRGAYEVETLLQWAEQVKEWRASGLRVWTFFNNDERGKSVRNALELREMVGEEGVGREAPAHADAAESAEHA